MPVAPSQEYINEISAKWRADRNIVNGRSVRSQSRGFTQASGSVGQGPSPNPSGPQAPVNGPGTHYELLAHAFAAALGVKLGCTACVADRDYMNSLWASEGKAGFDLERENLLKRLGDNFEKANVKWTPVTLAKAAWVGVMKGLSISFLMHGGDPVATMLDKSIELQEEQERIKNLKVAGT